MWLLFTGWYLKIKISDKIWNNHPLFCLSKKPSPSPLMMNGSISTVKTNHRSEARCGRGWLHWLHCTGLIFLPLQCTSSVERHSAVHIVVHNCTIAGAQLHIAGMDKTDLKLETTVNSTPPDKLSNSWVNWQNHTCTSSSSKTATTQALPSSSSTWSFQSQPWSPSWKLSTWFYS